MKSLPKETESWINEFVSELKFKKYSDEEKIDYIMEESLVELNMGQLNEDYENCCHSEGSKLMVDNVRNLGEFVVNKIGDDDSLLISESSLKKSAKCLDLVTCDSTRTSCFTKK